MPVEIKELVIRAVVAGGPEGAGRTPDQGGNQTLTSEPDRAAIVNAAVREVLRILKSAKER